MKKNRGKGEAEKRRRDDGICMFVLLIRCVSNTVVVVYVVRPCVCVLPMYRLVASSGREEGGGGGREESDNGLCS